MMPKFESGRIVVAHSACCRDQSKQDHPDHDQHFDTAEPEFSLAEEPNTPVVDCNNCNQEERNVEGGACSFVVWIPFKPESNDEN